MLSGIKTGQVSVLAQRYLHTQCFPVVVRLKKIVCAIF